MRARLVLLPVPWVGCSGGPATPPEPPPEPPIVTCVPGSEPRTITPPRLDVTARLGDALAFLPGPWPRLVAGAPSHEFGEDTDGGTVAALWFLDRPLEDGEPLDDPIPRVVEDEYPWDEVFVAPVGDLDGDGLPDLGMAVDGYTPVHPSYALRDPSAVSEEDRPVAAPELGRIVTMVPRAFTCGDVDRDGFDDLCAPEGLVRGPMAPATRRSLDLEWGLTDRERRNPHTSVVPAFDRTRMLGTPAGLLLSDPLGHTLYRLVSFPAGLVDLAANADAAWSIDPGAGVTLLGWADLDGDGDGEAHAAVDGAVLHLGLDPAGGAVAGARTTLAHPVEAFVSADFDGDGGADLAVGGGGEVAVFLGPLPDGDLAWADADLVLHGRQPPTDAFGAAVAAYDWDRDGRAELAVGAPDEQSDPSRVSDSSEAFPLTAHGRVSLYCGGGLP